MAYEKGTGFQSDGVVDPTTSGSVTNGFLAVDRGGNALAFWSVDGSLPTLYAQRFTAGAWSPTQHTIATGVTIDFSPRFGFDGNGGGRLLWCESGSYAGQERNIFTRSFSAAGSFDSVGVVESVDQEITGPAQIAVDSAGNAIAVWTRSTGGSFHVWSNRYRAGSGWLGPEQVENNAGHAVAPQVVMDAAGNAIAAWMQSTAGSSSIWSSRSPRPW